MLRVCADLHLRSDVPICRGETEEEWMDLQRKSLEELSHFSEGIVIVGDIFHRPSSSPALTNIFLSALRMNHTYLMAGNHDIQMRNPDLARTSIGSLFYTSEHISQGWDCVEYGTDNVVRGAYTNHADFLFIHRLVFKSETDIPPGSDGISARQLLKLYPDYKVIVAGDNHDGFIYELNGRKVLVPGSMTIQSAKALDKKCYFYDIDEKTFEITKRPFPDTGELVSREHLDVANERDERLTAFVEALKKGGEVAFDFDANVEAALSASEINSETKVIVKEVLYGLPVS